MARTNQKHRNSRAAVAAAPAPIAEPAPNFYAKHKATREQSVAWFRSQLFRGLVSESDQEHLANCLRILQQDGGFNAFHDFFTGLLRMVENGEEVTPDLIQQENDKYSRDLFNTASADVLAFARTNPTLCRQLVEKGEQERRELFKEVQSGKAPEKEDS